MEDTVYQSQETICNFLWIKYYYCIFHSAGVSKYLRSTSADRNYCDLRWQKKKRIIPLFLWLSIQSTFFKFKLKPHHFSFTWQKDSWKWIKYEQKNLYWADSLLLLWAFLKSHASSNLVWFQLSLLVYFYTTRYFISWTK